MALGSLLKIMVALTLFYAGLGIFLRLDVLGILIGLVIIDVAIYQLDKGVRNHEVSVGDKLDSFKKEFADFTGNFSSKIEGITNIDEKLQTHKNDVSDLIDRIARKGLDLENRIIEVKKTVGAVYGALDDRLKVAENHLGIRKEVETEIEEEQVEEPITVSQNSVEYVDES